MIIIIIDYIALLLRVIREEEKSDRKIEKNKKTKSLTPTIKEKTIVEIDTDVDLSRVSKTRTILPKIIDSFKDVYHSSHYYNTNQNHIQNPNTNFTSNKASFSPICIENDVEEYNENLPTPLKFRKYQ
ncbi:hypothetical protein A3Q56_04165 [Intoshia linei]|uniref:Uncharacterized protein n=1 Tax=Intoshia linei TaxID=1819745 RepID=A0A177B1F6_9BILA|nr:hypothetical protein A3Q56_04165 [Intoshia linei]